MWAGDQLDLEDLEESLTWSDRPEIIVGDKPYIGTNYQATNLLLTNHRSLAATRMD